MKIKALIPVRSGSLRVQDKNIRPFANDSLLAIKIKQLQRIYKIGLIDDVVVNSNCEIMLQLARNMQATCVKRDSYYASNEIMANDLYENLAQNIDSDVILVAHVTSPLISDQTIINCIEIFKSNIHIFDSLATVNLIKQFLWLNGKALNYNPNYKPRSQDLPDVLALNHAICILPRHIMKTKKDLLGYKPNFYKVGELEGIDIDNMIDFEIAEILYKKYVVENKLYINNDCNRGGV